MLVQTSENYDQREMNDVHNAQLDGACPTTDLYGNSSSHPIDLSSPSPMSEGSEGEDDDNQGTASLDDSQKVERVQGTFSVEPTTAQSPSRKSGFTREQVVSVNKNVASLAAQEHPSTPIWSPEIGETSQVMGHSWDSSAKKQSSLDSLRAENLPPIRLVPQTRNHRGLCDVDITSGQDCHLPKSPVPDDVDNCVLPSVRDTYPPRSDLFGEEDEEEDYDGGSIRLSTDDEDEKASMDEAEAELECDIDEMLGNGEL